MFHTNQAEVHSFLATFLRCWGAGRQATFHLDTRGGEAWAQLGLGLGPPGAPRPGAPAGPHQHRHKHPHHPPGAPGGEAARPARHRPPSDHRRSAARRAQFLAGREAAASAAATLNLPAGGPATSESQVAPASATFYNHFADLDSRPPLATIVTLALDSRTTPTSLTSITSSNTAPTSSHPFYNSSSPSLPHATELSSSTRVVERGEVEGSRRMVRGRRRGAAVILDLPPHLASPLQQVDGPPPVTTPAHSPSPSPVPSPRLPPVPPPRPSLISSPRSSPISSPRPSPGPAPLPTFGPEWPPPPGPWDAHFSTSDPTVTCTHCGANPVCLDDSTPGWGALCPYCTYTVRNPW